VRNETTTETGYKMLQATVNKKNDSACLQHIEFLTKREIEVDQKPTGIRSGEILNTGRRRSKRLKSALNLFM